MQDFLFEKVENMLLWEVIYWHLSNVSSVYNTDSCSQTEADLCFTWLCSWTNCCCLSLEGLLSTPPPKLLIWLAFLDTPLILLWKTQNLKLKKHWFIDGILSHLVPPLDSRLWSMWFQSGQSTAVNQSWCWMWAGDKRKPTVFSFSVLSCSPAHAFLVAGSSAGHPRGWTAALSPVQ